MLPVGLALALWLVPALGAAQGALLVANLRHFQRATPASVAPDASDPEAAGDSVQVSVLVPARDEGAQIDACLAGILAQQGVPFELLVLDDHSRDNTRLRVLAASQADARCRPLAGERLPAGWTGKNHACAQLAYEAAGDWLLFVDADTRLAPGAIEAALAHARASGADLFGFWPRQTMESAGERLMLPLLAAILLGFLPLALAERLPDPRLAAANGQFLLFKRAAYERCGGHAAIAGELVDDVALARAVKAVGGKVVLRDAGALVSCRMYDSFGAVWAGFRKNLFPAFGGRPGPFLAGVGLFALLHALPLPLALAGAIAREPGLWLPFGLQLAIGYAGRAVLARQLGQPWRSVPWHPLASGLLVALALDSWRGHLRGDVTWKGRRYPRGG